MTKPTLQQMVQSKVSCLQFNPHLCTAVKLTDKSLGPGANTDYWDEYWNEYREQFGTEFAAEVEQILAGNPDIFQPLGNGQYGLADALQPLNFDNIKNNVPVVPPKYADGSTMQKGDHVSLAEAEVDARECQTVGHIKSFHWNMFGEGVSALVNVHLIGGEMISDIVQEALYGLEDAGKIDPGDYDVFEPEEDEEGNVKEDYYQFDFHCPTRDLVKCPE